MSASPAAVLAFWFGPPPVQRRDAWFRKDPAFDAAIRDRFGALIEAALAGTLGPAWSADARSRLAQVLLLDQFTRNAFRDSPRAFAGDPAARVVALRIIDAGEDRALQPLERAFAYLPLEHAEDLALQRRSVQLFGALAAADPSLADMLDYARRHRDVIARFGRFPHRNAILGRADTAEEADFLQQPGSRF